MSGAGRWGVRYSEFGQPGFCAVIEGRCRLHARRRGAGDARRRRLRAAAGDARLHHVRLRADRAGARSTSRAVPTPTQEVRHGRAEATAGRPAVRRSFHFRLSRRRAPRGTAAGDDPCPRRPTAFRCWCASLERRRATTPSAATSYSARLVEILLIEALRAAPRDDASPSSAARAGGSAHRPGAQADARRRRAALDRRRAGARDRDVLIGLLRPLRTHRRHTPDGVSARLAHGRRQEISCAAASDRAGRGRTTRRLWLGQHLQHRLQPACRPAAGPLRARTRRGRRPDRRTGLRTRSPPAHRTT